MIEILDGGMIFELNKLYNDLGQEALLRNPKVIENIYQEYIDMGCHYITTCNYGFKSLKLDNWKDLVSRSVELTTYLKIKNNKIKFLGCLPPYHESYHKGLVTDEFLKFYQFIIATMIGKVDSFICETQISVNHINAILSTLVYYQKFLNKKTKILISIYPTNNIKLEEIEMMLERYGEYIEGILINCCSFSEMKEYYSKYISNLNLSEKQIKFGFYCNMLDEKKYSSYSGNKEDDFKLLDFKNEDVIDKSELYQFLEELELKNIKIIIGGCCGYGIEEMKELVSLINYYHISKGARL